MKQPPRPSIIAVGVAIGVIFFIAGFLVREWMSAPTGVPEGGAISQIRESSFAQKKYQWIDPLLGCAIVDNQKTEFEGLQAKMVDIISHAVDANQASDVSVYLDTRNGKWMTVYPEKMYAPASLLKVPIMMALHHAAEDNPDILKKKVLYDGKRNTNQTPHTIPQASLKINTQYTMAELLSYMIKYSDNQATSLLRYELGKNNFSEVLADLGVFIPPYIGPIDDFITVKGYANFFRVLYNASYLSRENSEKALALLTETQFKDGIVAGVPETVPVAHKFGERGVLGGEEAPKQLHDCGIVYYPKQHYLLCIMTKGNDFEDLAAVIRDISAATFQYMEDEH